MVLGKSIFLTSGRLLLGAGSRINDTIMTKLIARGYSHVYIMEKGTEDIIPEDVISDEIRMQAKSEIADKVSEINKALKFKDMTREKMRDLLEKGYLEQFNISFDLRQIAKEIINIRNFPYGVLVYQVEGNKIYDRNSWGSNILYIKKDGNYFLESELQNK